jgi:uncharacterized iron-regulated membrane protein
MAHANRQIQQTRRKLHLWVGLVAGAFIVMMGLTGMIIVFKPALEGAAAPQTKSGRAFASLGAMERSFAAASPGARITRVTIPDNSPGLLLVQAETESRQRVQVYFDAASGRDLGAQKSLSWLEWITDLHQNLLMGKTGRRLTGMIGFALLFVAFSGIVSWLVGARNWKRGFAIPKGGPWRRINYESHRYAGLWANILLLTVSLTGIILAYPDTFQAVVRLAANEQRTPREDRKRDAGRNSVKRVLPLDAYVRAATSAIPEGIVRELKMPKKWPRGGVGDIVDAHRRPAEGRKRRTAKPNLCRRAVCRPVVERASFQTARRSCQCDSQDRTRRIAGQAGPVYAGPRASFAVPQRRSNLVGPETECPTLQSRP